MVQTPERQRSAPIFLDLRRLHFPIGAVASILHRITGLLLVLVLPVGLGCLDYSTRSPSHFAQLCELLNTPWSALLLGGIGGSAVHHLLFGIRVILIEAGVGARLRVARRSAWVTLGGAVAVAAFVVWAVWP